jgi:Flp pilus assembly protein TadG
MEFALIAPVMVLMLFGVYELCNMAIVYEEVQNAAHSIPASASNLAVQGLNGSTYLTYAQVQLTASEIWGEIPELRSGFEDGSKYVTISSVAFIPTLPPAAPANQNPQPSSTCTPVKGGQTCNYTPTVIWSVAYGGGTSARSFTQDSSVLRSCTGAPTYGAQSNATVLYNNAGALSYNKLPGGLNNEQPPSLKAAPSWADSDLASLPTFAVANPDPNLAPPSPVLVVDIHVKYLPVFGLFFKKGIDFYATGFYPVRSVQVSTSSTNGAGVTTISPETLSQQFTTIQQSTLSSAPAGSYCVNTSVYLSPAASTWSPS